MNLEIGYLYTLVATLGTLLSAGALIVGSAWLWALKSWREAAPLIATTGLYLALFFGSPPPAIQAAFNHETYTLWDAARLLVFGVALMLLAHSAYLAWCESNTIAKQNSELERQILMLKLGDVELEDAIEALKAGDRSKSLNSSGHFGGGHGA